MKTTTETNRIRSATLFTSRGARNPGNQAVTSHVPNLCAPDLTQRPPRSPRSRLGGYALLPRMLDKARATLAGTNGAYHFDCPLDKRILSFVGIDPKKLLAGLKKGKGDGEILEWIQANAKLTRTREDVKTWADLLELDDFVSFGGKA